MSTAEAVSNAWRAMPDTMMGHLTAGQQTPPPHLQLVSYFEYLVGAGIIDRLSISLPPGHAKSELTSHWFPVWTFGHKPDSKIILAQYEATLAREWGKTIRATIAEHGEQLGVHLLEDSTAADWWRTTAGGMMRSAGAGATITGLRAHLFLIDDPHKNFIEAHSPTITETIWNWYRSTARTRLFPRAAVVLIMTRWSSLDLVAHLEEQQKGRWLHVRLPAVAEGTETLKDVIGEQWVHKLQALGVPLPVWHREAGQPLWPSRFNPDTGLLEPWFDETELANARLEVGEYIWAGLYQQKPPQIGGSMFDPTKWVTATMVGGIIRDKQSGHVLCELSTLRLVRWWDLAGTEKQKSNDPDWTVGVLMGRDKSTGLVYVLDVVRERLAPNQVEDLVRRTSVSDFNKYGLQRVRMNQDPAQAGKALISYYKRFIMMQFDFDGLLESGPIEARATPYAGQENAGHVYLVEGSWNDAYVIEHTAFNTGAHDDQVAASAMAYSDLAGLGKDRIRVIV